MLEISKQFQRICGPIQQIVFDNSLKLSDYKLLEVDSDLLDKIMDGNE